MTSSQQVILEQQPIQSLTLLAIRHPGKDRSLLALYSKYNRSQPRDVRWHIEAGPSTKSIDFIKEGTLVFGFSVHKGSEYRTFELMGNCTKKVVVAGDNEWLLVVTGTLWMYKAGDKDQIKAENIVIPCYYNSHTRKGFGLVPLITSYEVYGASLWELQAE